MPDAEIELCDVCGKVDVTGLAACCESCAPIYEVASIYATYYRGRSLRRAWEVHCYLDLARYHGALILVPEALDLDHDGLSEREHHVLESWDVYEGGAFLAVHTCIAPSDDELAARAVEQARAA